MIRPRLIERNGETVAALDLDLRSVTPWAPSVQQVRDCILAYHIAGPDFSQSMDLREEAREYVPNQREVEMVNDYGAEAVTAGRFFDFGHLPNDVIRTAGHRGGLLWQERALAMPFDAPWILYHSWEGGVSVYLVNPRSEGVEICEFQPTRLGTDPSLLIGDRGIFWQDCPKPDWKGYYATMAPSAVRYQRDPAHFARANAGASDPRMAAAGNIGDPVMAAVLMLNTRNVERETIRAAAKLQHARAKRGKPPIPDYHRVNVLPYVTAIMLGKSGVRGEDKGGSHRSPVPHIRHGHPRLYASGRTIFIHDTLVAVPPEQRAAFKSQRSHYAVRQ